MRRHAEAAGRDPASVDVAVFAPGYRLGAPHHDAGGRRVTFTGSAEQIAQDARAFRATGLKHLVIGFESADLQESLDRIESFAKDVIPLVG